MITLMMEAVSSSQISVSVYQIMRGNIPEYSHLIFKMSYRLYVNNYEYGDGSTL
jgi:hypothetical protein